MDAKVGVRMGSGIGGRFREPGAWNEEAGGGDPVLVESLSRSSVHRVVHAEVVSVYDQQTAAGGITQAFLDGSNRGLGPRCSCPEEGEEEQEDWLSAQPPAFPAGAAGPQRAAAGPLGAALGRT